jgi:hypothetical protein
MKQVVICRPKGSKFLDRVSGGIKAIRKKAETKVLKNFKKTLAD